MITNLKISDVKPGDVLRWDEVLDVHRGTTKPVLAVVAGKLGQNIYTADERILWWPTLSAHHNLRTDPMTDEERFAAVTPPRHDPIPDGFCQLCDAPAILYPGRMRQCTATPGHMADVVTGLWSDHTPPPSPEKKACL